MCDVKWCRGERRYYNNGREKKYCSLHSQYGKWVKNAPHRPWLMYKLEKILSGELYCENCGWDPVISYPDREERVVCSLLDVDHIDPTKKGTDEGEMPDNYLLVCKHCHILKSHDGGDFIPKKYR